MENGGGESRVYRDGFHFLSGGVKYVIIGCYQARGGVVHTACWCTIQWSEETGRTCSDLGEIRNWRHPKLACDKAHERYLIFTTITLSHVNRFL